jgi:hypothetical protein
MGKMEAEGKATSFNDPTFWGHLPHPHIVTPLLSYGRNLPQPIVRYGSYMLYNFSRARPTSWSCRPISLSQATFNSGEIAYEIYKWGMRMCG